MGALDADHGVIQLLGKDLSPGDRHRQARDGNVARCGLWKILVERVASEKAAALVSDAATDERLSSVRTSIGMYFIRSIVVVPILQGDALVGVIHLDSTRQAGAFSGEDLALLEATAAQVALVLDPSP